MPEEKPTENSALWFLLGSMAGRGVPREVLQRAFIAAKNHDLRSVEEIFLLQQLPLFGEDEPPLDPHTVSVEIARAIAREVGEGVAGGLRESINSELQDLRMRTNLADRTSDAARAAAAQATARVSEHEKRTATDVRALDFRLREIVEQHALELSGRIDKLGLETHAMLYRASIGMDPGELRAHQYCPVRIYIADAEVAEGQKKFTQRTILEALDLLGFSVAHELPDHLGSWGKELWAKTKGLFTRKEVRDQLDEVRHGLQTNLINKPQSETTRNYAEAVKLLSESLQGVKNGGYQLGSLLLVKTTNEKGEVTQAARTLTLEELRFLEQNPTVLHDPQTLHVRLDEVSKSARAEPRRLADRTEPPTVDAKPSA